MIRGRQASCDLDRLQATFRNWFLKSADGNEAEFARLVSPIGGAAVRDKRPQVIAALAAAEIMTALASYVLRPWPDGMG